MKLQLEHTFARDLEGLYIPHTPQGFPQPELMLFNDALNEALGLPEVTPEQAAMLFSGSGLPDDAEPLAQAYAGHQFGGFNPQLGDGRATLIGEKVAPDRRRFDLQLKGSGRTPFSRGGDGRAAVGPVLREYLVSEAMHHLGVPTTRVLAAIKTGETIRRETPLPGAVLTRVAASHLRVGTLQFFSAREDHESLKRLVDYTLQRHFPDRVGAESPALALLNGVALAQANLIARWMHVGFVHGVMNTDNFALSGETIDYGPCAFMDTYDPATVFSSIDHHGRYAYGNQPGIGKWNLARMGEALLPLLNADQDAAVKQVYGVLDLYQSTFEGHFLAGMRRKFGLVGDEAGDAPLISTFFDWMRDTHKDFTSTFRALARGLREDALPFDDVPFAQWHTRWRARHGDAEPASVADAMDRVNPLYIPRNHLVEEVLEAAEGGDLDPIRTLLQVLASPFEVQAGRERYAEPAPASFGCYRTFCGT
ncbi:MAG: protein adenylyltransferase SelO [Bradymonadia bacterium]